MNTDLENNNNNQKNKNAKIDNLRNEAQEKINSSLNGHKLKNSPPPVPPKPSLSKKQKSKKNPEKNTDPQIVNNIENKPAETKENQEPLQESPETPTVTNTRDNTIKQTSSPEASSQQDTQTPQVAQKTKTINNKSFFKSPLKILIFLLTLVGLIIGSFC